MDKFLLACCVLLMGGLSFMGGIAAYRLIKPAKPAYTEMVGPICQSAANEFERAMLSCPLTQTR